MEQDFEFKNKSPKGVSVGQNISFYYKIYFCFTNLNQVNIIYLFFTFCSVQ